MKFVCAVLSALALAAISFVLLTVKIHGYTQLASSEPIQLGQQYYQDGISESETQKHPDGSPVVMKRYETVQEATIAATKDIEAGKKLLSHKMQLGEDVVIFVAAFAVAGFIGWFLFFLGIYVTTRPLETILDSMFGNFMRYYFGPTLSTLLFGSIAAFIGSVMIVGSIKRSPDQTPLSAMTTVQPSTLPTTVQLPANTSAAPVAVQPSNNVTSSVQMQASAAPVPVQRAGNQQLYQIRGLGADDLLNMRSGPGVNFPVVVKLRGDQTDIVLLNGVSVNGQTRWQRIMVLGQFGWVNSAFLGPAQ